MNKFNHLQIIGTTILVLPLVVVFSMVSFYEFQQTKKSTEVVTTVIEIKVEPKKDTVVEVTEVVKETPKPTPPPPPAPKPIVKDTLPKVVVQSDSIVVDEPEMVVDTTNNTKPDTTQTINY